MGSHEPELAGSQSDGSECWDGRDDDEVVSLSSRKDDALVANLDKSLPFQTGIFSNPGAAPSALQKIADQEATDSKASSRSGELKAVQRLQEKGPSDPMPSFQGVRRF